MFTLQTLPAEPEAPGREVAESSGFSLHAGIAAQGWQRDKLEHLTRYHGVFAPASPDRARVVPKTRAANERGDVSTSGRQHAPTWAQRLKRVFAIDIETCRQCGGWLRVIACI